MNFLVGLFLFMDQILEYMSIEACSEPFQTAKIEVFAKIANGCKPLTIFTKTSILNV